MAKQLSDPTLQVLLCTAFFTHEPFGSMRFDLNRSAARTTAMEFFFEAQTERSLFWRCWPRSDSRIGAVSERSPRANCPDLKIDNGWSGVSLHRSFGSCLLVPSWPRRALRPRPLYNPSISDGCTKALAAPSLLANSINLKFGYNSKFGPFNDNLYSVLLFSGWLFRFIWSSN